MWQKMKSLNKKASFGYKKCHYSGKPSSTRQTTEGRKNLGNTYVNVYEILRRFAPLNDRKKVGG